MKRSEQINELAAALAKAQAEIKVAPKDNVAKTEKYSYSYSTLADVWEACRSALSKHGLSIIQTTETEGPKASVTTLLLHSSGQWIENTLTLAGRDGSPQSIGGCITYARRYALGAMVGVVSEEDDDASGASGREAQTSRKNNGNSHTSQAPEDTQKAAAGNGAAAVSQATAFAATADAITSAGSAGDLAVISERLPKIDLTEGQRRILKARLDARLKQVGGAQA